jgi:hypothetical protein
MTFKGSQNNNFAQVATPGGESGEPQPTTQSTAPLCDEFGRLIVVIDGLVSTTGGGGGGGDSFPLIPSQVGTPTANHWSLFPGGIFTFPATSTFETRIGFLTLGPTTVTAPVGIQFIYNGALVEGPATVDIPAAVYVEWSYVQSPFGDTTLWAPRGMSNEGGGGSPGGGDLVYAPGFAPLDGQWVIATNNTASTLPDATAADMHIGVFVPLDANGASVSSNSLIYDGRILSDPVYLRAGGWYEWTTIDRGEDGFAWVPRGGQGFENKPALELADFLSGVLPNQWIRASDGASPLHMPTNQMDGDCFAVFVDIPTLNIAPDAAADIMSPDGLTLVSYPATLAVTGTTFYEWFYNDSDGVWYPRHSATQDYIYSLIAGGTTALSLGGKKITNLADPTSAQDAATRAYVLSQIPAPVVATSKTPCRLVATTPQPLSGLTTIDGVSPASGDRILLTSQAATQDNGIYVAAAGAWARASDANTSAQLVSGTLIPVSEGTTGQDTIWSLTTNAPIVLGTTALLFQVMGGLRGTANVPRAIAPGFASGAVGSNNHWAASDHIHPFVSTYKEPVRVAATLNVATLSGLQTIDSVALANNDRVLLFGQSTQSQNGIWIASTGAWVRATDASSAADFAAGMMVYVSEGGSNSGVTLLLTTLGAITVGTTNLTFVFFGGQRTTNSAAAIIPTVSAGSGGSSKWAPIDHIHSFPAVNPSLNDFRLSNFTTPIIGNGTNIGILFLARFKGQRISLYFGSEWYVVTCPTAADSSIAITGQTAGVPFDVFAVQNGLVAAPNLEILAWSNTTNRATPLALQDGVWVKTGAASRRYIGTVLPNSATTCAHVRDASDANPAVCGIWNQDNRVPGSFNWTPTFASASPVATSTWEAFGNIATPHIQAVVGQTFDSLSLRAIAGANPSATGETAIGVGVNSLVTPSGIRSKIGGQSLIGSVHANHSYIPAVGRQNINMLSFSSSATALVYGTQAPLQSGISLDMFY